jgi:hypothetical protein
LQQATPQTANPPVPANGFLHTHGKGNPQPGPFIGWDQFLHCGVSKKWKDAQELRLSNFHKVEVVKHALAKLLHHSHLGDVLQGVGSSEQGASSPPPPMEAEMHSGPGTADQ